MSQLEVTAADMADVSVLLAMPVHRMLDWEVARSLLETQALMHQKGIRCEITFGAGGDTVITGRSRLAAAFLTSGHNRLFSIDSDIIWKPSDFLRFVLLSTRMECVVGIYAHRAEPIRFFLDAETEFSVNEYGCVPIRGCGLGFTIVQRTVIEQLAAKAPKVRFPDTGLIPHITRTGIVGDEWQGEDHAFFEDIRNLGYVVNLDPTVTLGHVGSKVYSASIMDFLTPKTETTK